MLAEILRLPLEERARLALELIRSLDTHTIPMPPERGTRRSCVGVRKWMRELRKRSRSRNTGRTCDSGEPRARIGESFDSIGSQLRRWIGKSNTTSRTKSSRRGARRRNRRGLIADRPISRSRTPGGAIAKIGRWPRLIGSRSPFHTRSRTTASSFSRSHTRAGGPTTGRDAVLVHTNELHRRAPRLRCRIVSLFRPGEPGYSGSERSGEP